jgi:NADH dehydrogenase
MATAIDGSFGLPVRMSRTMLNSHDGAAEESRSPHRVVVIGGGFGGLAVARELARAEGVLVTVIDKRNFHLFQPLLYQVATGALSPGDVASPLREVLRRSPHTRVLLGDAVDIDVEHRSVVVRDTAASSTRSGEAPNHQQIPYDTLVVAAGLVSNYFGHDEWERWAPGLKSVEDATEVRSRLLLAFEEAEHENDEAVTRALLTFVIVGAGPTGVEMAGAITEIAADTLPVEFRRIQKEKARVVLVDAGPRVLAGFHESLSAAAERDLRAMGVEVRTQTMVREVDSGGVVVEMASSDPAAGGTRERIEARLIVWAAGVRGTALASRLAEKTGATPTRQGTIPVDADLSLPGHPEIHVIGDYAGRLVVARLADQRLPAFRYEDRGSMATIGKAKAVADLGWTRLTGFVAWVAWLFVHLLFLVGYENRVLVLTQWAWYYVWRRRSARLITAWHPEN